MTKMTKEMLPEVMTVKDVQEYLKISKNSAYDLIKRNKFKSINVGRQIRIPKRGFLEWIEG